MKKYILPIVSAGLLLTGCSAAYKTGQTPDDVYYSQPKHSVAVVQQESEPGTEYQSYFKDEDDAYLRMKVQNGGKWNTIDDFDYWYGYNSYNMYNPYMSPYTSGYALGYTSYWGMNTFSITYGSYSPWFGSYYYSPYKLYTPYCPVVINKRPTYYSNGFRPSLSGYSNPNYDRGGNYRAVHPSSNQSSFRNIFNSGGSNSGSYDRPSRSVNSSGSYSSPSSSGSGGGGRSSGSSSGSSSGGGRGGRGGL
jgi:hypothetical protein